MNELPKKLIGIFEGLGVFLADCQYLTVLDSTSLPKLVILCPDESTMKKMEQFLQINQAQQAEIERLEKIVAISAGEMANSPSGCFYKMMAELKSKIVDLQAELDRVKKELCSGCVYLEQDAEIINEHIDKEIVMDKQIANQQAEIEQLTQKGQKLCCEYGVLFQKFYGQQTEIDRLKTEIQQFAKAVEGLLPLCKCNNIDHSRRISFAGDTLAASKKLKNKQTSG